ncbi:MAG: polyprenyl synthetase family protein, partial [Actinomycetota bacterium]
MSAVGYADLLAVGPVRGYLARVEERLAADVAWVGGSTAATAAETLAAGGKRLRPLLVLLSAPAVRQDDDALVRAGSAVELVHMATLVHDDVLDEAKVRRKGATLNALRGNEAAVMLGDYLISNAFHLCSRIGRPELNLDLGAVTNTLCEGELVQLHHRDDLALDEATYFGIVRGKTAVLVGAACRLGARLSNAPEAAVA